MLSKSKKQRSDSIAYSSNSISHPQTIEGGSFESTPEAKEYRLLINREIDGCECKNGLSRVYIHPSSINFSEREYTYPFMIYVTNVSPALWIDYYS